MTLQHSSADWFAHSACFCAPAPTTQQHRLARALSPYQRAQTTPIILHVQLVWAVSRLRANSRGRLGRKFEEDCLARVEILKQQVCHGLCLHCAALLAESPTSMGKQASPVLLFWIRAQGLGMVLPTSHACFTKRLASTQGK